jgi:hypothetical protein
MEPSPGNHSWNQAIQTQKEDMTMTTMINPHENGRKRASLNEQC